MEYFLTRLSAEGLTFVAHQQLQLNCAACSAAIFFYGCSQRQFWKVGSLETSEAFILDGGRSVWRVGQMTTSFGVHILDGAIHYFIKEQTRKWQCLSCQLTVGWKRTRKMGAGGEWITTNGEEIGFVEHCSAVVCTRHIQQMIHQVGSCLI